MTYFSLGNTQQYFTFLFLLYLIVFLTDNFMQPSEIDTRIIITHCGWLSTSPSAITYSLVNLETQRTISEFMLFFGFTITRPIIGPSGLAYLTMHNSGLLSRMSAMYRRQNLSMGPNYLADLAYSNLIYANFGNLRLYLSVEGMRWGGIQRRSAIFSAMDIAALLMIQFITVLIVQQNLQPFNEDYQSFYKECNRTKHNRRQMLIFGYLNIILIIIFEKSGEIKGLQRMLSKYGSQFLKGFNLLQIYIIISSKQMSNYSYLFKLIVIGDTSVGKSCILLNFLQKKFKFDHDTTIGVQFGSKIINIATHSVKLQIWDTAGQETFKSITRSYYRGSIGVILVYDITNRESFNNINKWIDETKTYSNDKITAFLVGNKTDLENKRAVSYDEGFNMAKKNGLLFMECSAKSGQNIEAIFGQISQTIVGKIERGQIDPKNESIGVKLGNLQKEVRKERGCC